MEAYLETLSHRIQKLAENNPEQIAIISTDEVQLYPAFWQSIEAWKSCLINYLATNYTNNLDTVYFGIATSRTITGINALVAIHLLQFGYVPLDSKLPKKRLQDIIKATKIKVVICSETESEFYSSLGLHCITTNEASTIDSSKSITTKSEDAYILFTSGSTGMPKGVKMGFTALHNLLSWQEKNSEADLGTRTLQFSPLTFDVSFQEIFSTFYTWGTLVLMPETLVLEPAKFLDYLIKHEVNRLFLPFVALQYLAESAARLDTYPQSLQEVITAGEQLKITSQLVNLFEQLPSAKLFNQYGPTETHVVCQYVLEGDASTWPALPSIGTPIDGVQFIVVDEKLNLVSIGTEGELLVGGLALANGYANDGSLTNEKFIHWPINNSERYYRTGDLVIESENGTYQFIGRIDQQVKISGFRVEPAEIELLLEKIDGIAQVAVVPHTYSSGQIKLIAYLEGIENREVVANAREALHEALPSYMTPSAFVWVATFPRTSSGKIDRKAFVMPDNHRPTLAVPYQKYSTITEKNLLQVWEQVLDIEGIGIHDNFFELGGNSLLAVQAIAKINAQYAYALTITNLYECLTIKHLADSIESNSSIKENPKRSATLPNYLDKIAVVGFSGRFPAANSVAELWENLQSGKDCIQHFSPKELSPFIAAEERNDPNYVAARGIIADAEKFDAGFFGINPKLAECMDPQQRIMLEIAVEALERSGHLNADFTGTIGVFAGTGNNSYYLTHVLSHPEIVESLGAFQIMTLNEKDYIASRTAFSLNLTGPAVSVHSGCSTSLLAIAEAVASLQNGQCDVAIAGGVSITAPIASGHLYQEGAMFSKDGQTRPFDSEATGTVFSDGAGLVVLSRLTDAEASGSTIYATIAGIGVNNDGAAKSSFTAPSSKGQADVIRQALAQANWQAESIGYIEAHGTATPIGDPIEFQGLIDAFGQTAVKQFCALGSIKSNVGHLTAAAGVAGFIKAVLCVHHKTLVPTLHYSKPNPIIDFENSPFFVNTELTSWECDSRRRAGVSSFGVGGTNVHILIEEYSPAVIPELISLRPETLFCLSAKSENSLGLNAEKLAGYLSFQPETALESISAQYNQNQIYWPYRAFATGAYSSNIVHTLQKPVAKSYSAIQKTAFVFPGQGAQYLNMGAQLYKHEGVYKHWVDYCASILKPHLGLDIRELIFNPSESNRHLIHNTEFTQPALFVTGYSLAQLWISWGIAPSALIGHSIGEYVAASVSGVFSLDDALYLVAKRGKLMASMPAGAMLAVALSESELLELVPNTLSISAINSPNACVVAGETEIVNSFHKELEAQNISAKVLNASHAFHSDMMDEAAFAFEKEFQHITFGQLSIPIISTQTGKLLSQVEASSPTYWAQQIRNTVRFSEAVLTLIGNDDWATIECGPSQVCTQLIKQIVPNNSVLALPSLPKNNTNTDYSILLQSLGKLWTHGLPINWKAFYGSKPRPRYDIPTYSFDRKTYWLNPKTAAPSIVVSNNLAIPNNISPFIPIAINAPIPAMNRSLQLDRKVRHLLEELSGIGMNDVPLNSTLIEAGLDSLVLTSVAIALKKEFKLAITFRQLNEEYNTLQALIQFLDDNLPEQYFGATEQVAVSPMQATVQSVSAPSSNDALSQIAAQLHLLSQQVAQLQSPQTAAQSTIPTLKAPEVSAEEMAEIKKPYGAIARIEKQKTELSDSQSAFLQELEQRYNAKTSGSKNFTQEHRKHIADPRVVSGFRPLTKELVYPIVVNRSKGSRVWDIDSNEYIDVLNGFGSNLLGHSPEIIAEALHQQIDSGYEIGPMHPHIAEVSSLFCELTGADRVGFCNTGSEAILGAMRIARTVTGRTLIVAFTGSYHGIVDEVLVRGSKSLRTFPASPGIMPESVQNMLILDYGTDESLQIIRERAHELAAVLVEPVQSRRPEFQPIAFLQELRKITEQSGTALVFDEVITGFRMHPGGAQALFGIKADIGTYGKVVGGGMPIGAIAGKKLWLDALDGGFWQYGDDSIPESGVTYFAGTFVRHPFALAAARVTLRFLKEQGSSLQGALCKKTRRLAAAMNATCEAEKLPMYIAHFGSLWKIKGHDTTPYSELLFTLMREKGIHIWDLFPCFMTAAHSDADVKAISAAFKESVIEMKAAGFFAGQAQAQKIVPELVAKVPSYSTSGSETIHTPILPEVPMPKPPREGAMLGKDANGNPAWFVEDPERKGKFLIITD